MWPPTLCISERIWVAGSLQACSQQPLYRGQLKPIPCSPCHMHADSTEAPPPIWTAAIHWWGFRIPWKTHWLKEIFCMWQCMILPGKEFCSEYHFLFSDLFKFVAAITHKADIFRTAKQSLTHHCCHQLLPDELWLLEEPPLLLMSEHIQWVRPIHLHSDDVLHTLY